MRYVLFFCTLLMCFPQVAFAEVKRIAVLEFQGVDITDNKLLQILSDGVRTTLTDSVDVRQYQIMTRESTLLILKDMGKDPSCINTGECEVEIGRNIGADYVISGIVSFYAETYFLTLKLHETQSAALISSAQNKQKDGLALIDNIAVQGQHLMNKAGLMQEKGRVKEDQTEVIVEGGGTSDFASLAAEVKRKKNEKKRVEREARAAEEAFEKEIDKRLDHAEKTMLEKARKDWGSLASVIKDNEEECIPLVEQFIEEYSSVTLRIEGRERIVTVFEVAQATKWLQNQKSHARKNLEAEILDSQTNKTSILLGKGYDINLIPAGRFIMGCTKGDGDCDGDEKPKHTVKLTRPFYMMTTEVTQELYQSVTGNNPSHFSDCGKHCPVDSVSWYDAVYFSNLLSEREGLEKCYHIGKGETETVKWKNKNCGGWRLPTEAEWEYAARGKEEYIYAGSSVMDDVAWFGGYVFENKGWVKKGTGNGAEQSHPVGQKKSNGFGMYDMSGNVWEWVWDSWKRKYLYTVTNPEHVNRNVGMRVRRGGSWNDGPQRLRVSCRDRSNASNHVINLGFRLVRSFQ